MAQATSGRANIFPALRYKNGSAALEWLGKAFGFEKHFVVPGAGDQVAHAQMVFGPGMIMLGSGKGEGENPWETTPQGIYVYVEDVDAHYARAKAAGAEIVRDLANTDYGSREYSARDFEGHLWSFGSYDPWK
jgi:uncharacterized glyoxalase superfamily protein PhnB